MRLPTHQMLGAWLVIPFGLVGMLAGAWFAIRLGLPGVDNPLLDLRQFVTLALMFALGWICSMPVQWAFDRLIPAHCPSCARNTSYRCWPSLRRYRCRSCGAESKC